MLSIDFSQEGVAVVTALGSISSDDIAELRSRIDDHVNRNDVVPNLVIKADGFPGWDSPAAFFAHMKFIEGHHKIVRKVAVVGDSPLMLILPAVADYFVAAKLRHFPADRLNAAVEWAQAEEDHPGGFDVLDGFPDDVLAVRALGTITSRDYLETLIPMADEKWERHEKLKLLFLLDEAYDGWSPGAAWNDMRFDITHWNDVSAIALVTDVGWIAQSVRLFAPLMPARVKVFTTAQLDEARSWIMH